MVISASHNPFGDNGIKLFGAGGHQADRRTSRPPSRTSSHRVLDPTVKGPRPLEGHGVGTVRTEPDLGRRPTSSTCSARSTGRRLDGLRIVVDSANGSALGGWPPRCSDGLGAEVVAIGDEPDGTNINAGCGSTATEPAVAAPWSSTGADLGLALDGDADRLLAVDETGALVDGDVAAGPVRPRPGRAGASWPATPWW